MFVKRFFEPSIAQASYLIGCQKTGEAIVIDANRDVEQYIHLAAQEELRITQVTETHIHADFVSGSRELAQRTGASLCLSDEGDRDWKYQFDHARKLKHGDRITVGNIRIDVLHTPGHTPEHLTFLITDGAAADQPIAAVTGDFVFVGDVGRPDLLERAANIKGTMEAGARTLFKSLQSFARHEDWLQIWPGHGAGSACGKGISAIPSSTLGYEKRFNWAFNAKSEDEFVTTVLAGQPEPPKYFAKMKRINKEGPAILGPVSHSIQARCREAPRAAGSQGAGDRHAARIGVRRRPRAGHDQHPLQFVVRDVGGVAGAGGRVLFDRRCRHGSGEARRTGPRARADRHRSHLRILRRGRGHRAGDHSVRSRQPSWRHDFNAVTVVDVRSANEWNEGHVPGAMHIPLGYLADRTSEIPAGKPVVVQCQSGGRSSIAASILERAGFRDVTNLTGGLGAWTAAGLPLDEAARLRRTASARQA